MSQIFYPAGNSITPKQVAEMATAGVKIEWKDIADRLECSSYTQMPDMEHPDSPEGLRRSLIQRLRWRSNEFAMERWPVDTLTCHKLNDEKVVTFVISNGVAQIIEDDYKLFPSDTLVTQIRLIEGKKETA